MLLICRLSFEIVSFACLTGCVSSLAHPWSACTSRYARSERLRNLVNLVVVGGVIDPEDTGDREERAECEKMHGLIKKYNLKVGEDRPGCAAWQKCPARCPAGDVVQSL